MPRWLALLLAVVALIAAIAFCGPALNFVQGLVAQPQGTEVEETTVEESTTTGTGTDTRATFTAADLNAAIGEGRWMCFPDRLDGVAITNCEPEC
jgi:hypothetical protein